MPSIDQINAFVSVYELQGYSAAARQLSKGRTTVRELIMTLEDQMDLALFDVQGRKVIATEPAVRLYFHAKSLQSQLMMFEDLTLTAHEKHEDKICICYDPLLPAELLVELSSLMYQKFPDVRLQWQIEDWQTAMNLVVENEAYVAFLPNKRRSFPDLKVEINFLGFQNIKMYTKSGGELDKLAEINHMDLRNNTQLLTHNAINSELTGHIRFAANYVALESYDDICRLLTKLGWAMIPESAAKPYLASGDIVEITPSFMLNDLQISMAAYYSPSIARGPALSFLIKQLAHLSQKFFS